MVGVYLVRWEKIGDEYGGKIYLFMLDVLGWK